MKSIREVTSGLAGVFSTIGIDVGFLVNPSNQEPKVLCFTNEKGRICEEIPLYEEIKCDKQDKCSIFLTGIEESNPIEKLANRFNLRSFLTKQNGISTINLTGVLSRDNLNLLAKEMNREFSIIEGSHLRKITEGDILPPPICNINPLSSKCESYLTSGNWHWGPKKGWRKADGFLKAVKNQNQSKIDKSESAPQNSKNNATYKGSDAIIG